MTTPRLNEIADFMAARHRIYLDRKAGKPGPWSDDPILAVGRFCNVFRELDTVTIWVRKNIRESYPDQKHLWFMLAIARYINWPPTLQLLIEEGAWPSMQSFKPSDMTRVLEAFARTGSKVYTGAYMIRAESDPNKEWYSWTKHRYIAEIVLGRLWEKRHRFMDLLAKPGVTLERTWAMFQAPEFVGWGPFMAYEVVTDLRHTRYLRNAPDIYTWANAGPGAIRGLNHMYGRPITTVPPKEQTNREMNQIMLELNALDDPEFNEVFGRVDPRQPRFEMRDVEHSLCELFKYVRGYTRSRYDWRKAKPL